jgi:hypothetical protein
LSIGNSCHDSRAERACYLSRFLHLHFLHVFWE